MKEGEFMSAKFKPGDAAYFIESGRIVRSVKIIRLTSDSCITKFTDGSDGGIRIRLNRLFATYEEAEDQIPSVKEVKEKQRKLNHYDYE